MKFICQSCNRPIPNRKQNSCSYCGAALRDDQKMSEEQKASLSDIKEKDAKRHKDWKERNPEPVYRGTGI